MYFSNLELVKLLARIQELCGTQVTYTHFLAADGWGQEIDVRSPNARRFDLSGALIRAVDDLCDPPDDHKRLLKLSNGREASKKSYATKELGRRGRHARVLYGFGWGMLNSASQEITAADLYAPKTFQTALDVLERAKLRVYATLGMSARDRPLGLWQQGEPFDPAEIQLLEELSVAGDAGCVPETGRELLACYDLYKRGLITEISNAPWTYKLRVLYTKKEEPDEP